MLKKYSYTFIIGAGGSYPYKFPLGNDLYNNIKNNYSSLVGKYYKQHPDNIDGSVIVKDAEIFTRELSKTSGVSIDKYLNINQRFLQEGMKAIIADIFHKEVNSILPINNPNSIKGDWYSYLYNKMIQGLNTKEDLLKIGSNKISFITFNYDRSIEHYLFENFHGLLINAGVSRKDLANIFLQFPFIHVYGQIGFLPWQKKIYYDGFPFSLKDSVVSYGFSELNPILLSKHNSNNIKVMYEERKETEEIKTVHEVIDKSDRIMFLGFGYDEDNLSILKLPELLEGKEVYGTAFNKTNNEIIHIKNLLNFEKLNKKSQINPYDCLKLLREHLIYKSFG